MIRTDYLARVEGEGAMYVKLDGREVLDVKLRIYEPPRFFEALLRGRAFTEAPDITARICGICPIAYQLTAVRAMEDACGVDIDDGPIRDLRRLIYCGEWIESHSLHIYMLHAPDFLGYAGAVEMAADHREIVEQGLRMKKAGKHADGARRRTRGPSDQRARRRLLPGAHACASCARCVSRCSAARETALATVRWTATLPFPEVIARRSSSRCADPGALPDRPRAHRLRRGLDIAPAEFGAHIVEEHVEHSNALHARLRERGTYLTGPLARYALASDALRPLAA